jgi:hypothetical protein
MVMPGMIAESTGLALKVEIDEDMRKMSMLMIWRMKTMMSLAEPYSFIVIFIRATLRRVKAPYGNDKVQRGPRTRSMAR